MSSHDALWSQWEKSMKEHGYSLEQLRKDFVKFGDNFLERFNDVGSALLLYPESKKTDKPENDTPEKWEPCSRCKEEMGTATECGYCGDKFGEETPLKRTYLLGDIRVCKTCYLTRDLDGNKLEKPRKLPEIFYKFM